jgi:hypothetical protein
MNKRMQKDIIYLGTWRGLGEIYNVRVGTGYTTIIVRPGEDVKKRSKETKKKFAGQASS